MGWSIGGMEAKHLTLQIARGQCIPSFRPEFSVLEFGVARRRALVVVDALALLPGKLMGTFLSAWTGLAKTGAALACAWRLETPGVLAVCPSSCVSCLSTDIWLPFANGGALIWCVVECRERLEW
jgi:hypothetical protein